MGVEDVKTETFPFIVTKNTRKVDAETRKLIRSHVMRGKNRIKPSKGTKQLIHPATPQVHSHDTFDTVAIPRVLCSKFSGIEFAADVEPAMIEDVLLFASMSTEAMFLLHRCLKAATSDTRQIWFAPMLSDPAYLHAACFTIQTFFDGLLARTRGVELIKRDRVYYAKTMRLLRERLAVDDDSVRLSDSTIMTVLTLSGHAYSMADYKTAEHHIDGLLKLVSMRGAHTFFHNIRILIEIVRSDLGMAIDRGRKPVLFTDTNIPWNLMPTKLDNCSDQLQITTDLFSNTLDCSLADIWSAASEFCIMINTAADDVGAQMAEELFLHYMGSIMYRLLHRRFEKGSLDEAFRLGLISFFSPVFLNWNRVELPDCRFNTTYREALAGLTLINNEAQTQLRLWLFMVAALSMSHEPDSLAWIVTWLQVEIISFGLQSWVDMKNFLSSYLWVGLVYDKPGEEIFDSILSKAEENVHV